MPSKFVGLIAAVVSILGFFGITRWEELAGVDESTVDADDGVSGGGAGGAGGGAGAGSVTHPSATSPPTADESISISLVLDIGEAVEAVARVQLATGEQVDLRVDQSSTHAEQWIDLECACRLGYEIELWTSTTAADGLIYEYYGAGSGELDAADGDVAGVVVRDWSTQPWVVELTE